MTGIVEKPGHVERWVLTTEYEDEEGRLHHDGEMIDWCEFRLTPKVAQKSFCEQSAMVLSAYDVPELLLSDDDLRELYHPSVVRAVQKRLGIVNKVTVGWVVKARDGRGYLDSTGRYVPRLADAQRFQQRSDARWLAIDGCVVVRLWRRG